MSVHRYRQLEVQPGRLVVNQMSQLIENTVPGHNLGNNTHCYRNLMCVWKRPTILEEGEKTQP